MSDETFACPRRREMGALVHSGYPDTDRWVEEADGNYRTCSWCGSMHPAELVNAIKANVEIGPTDKSYKLYVAYPSADRTLKFYTQHFEGTAYGDEFYDLWSAKQINWGYPGHPYVMLYVPSAPEEES